MTKEFGVQILSQCRGRCCIRYKAMSAHEGFRDQKGLFVDGGAYQARYYKISAGSSDIVNNIA